MHDKSEIFINFAIRKGKTIPAMQSRRTPFARKGEGSGVCHVCKTTKQRELKMKKEEIKELSIQELQAQIEAAEKAYRELKVAHAITPSDNPAKITRDRRHIARLKTVLRQKEIAQAAPAAK